MPIHFSIDEAAACVHAQVTGPLQEADPIHFIETLLDHPAYRPGLSVRVDCDALSVRDFTSVAVGRLAAFTRKVQGRFKLSRVAVVARQPVVFGLVRMYEMLREPPHEFRVFREHAEADAWLEERASEAPGP
ncbi:MAG: hypothetical protein HKP30_06720 [Myxococcales bacterium]|nr:hypothetical protein [Myxococcales bacterium]